MPEAGILIAGWPGVGKTTIIRMLMSELSKYSINVQGFYTEEVKDKKERIGFDVVTLDKKRGILARSSELNKGSGPRVGKYLVDINSFEQLVLPIFGDVADVYIIDEIGKMELFSENFEKNIRSLLTKIKNNEALLIATVPCRPIKLVQEIKALNNIRLFEVSKQNRNVIFKDILDACLKMLKVT